ncbi:ABC transporter permease [Tepidibacillus sp. HK-1]|uniref:ABC transporter permease n=1 Tax=Tepidibacillus sp. HK-1 TaxID=1883407 RepID=UPI0008563550|nr:ABC transporter permease [Tepidibacillus sp. HK-1]GBF10895.1 putative aliphatic sulfonates transport permease protein SsuC [Tepidibacillus sp. HK-1]
MKKESQIIKSIANQTILKPNKKVKRLSIKSTLPYVYAIVTLLVIWQIIAWFLPNFLLPDVVKVFQRFLSEVKDPAFLDSIQSSLIRLIIGYPLACLLGSLFGLLSGLSKGFKIYLKNVISILQSIPPITWIPFLVILFGFGDLPIIIVITIASFFPMALAMINATENINRTHLELAKVLGANKKQLVTKVFLPETFPSFLTGAQVAFGNAWRSLVASEMVGGAAVGLGWSISYAGEIADMEGVLLNIVVIGGIALILDHLVLEQLKRKFLRWRDLTGAGGSV